MKIIFLILSFELYAGIAPTNDFEINVKRALKVNNEPVACIETSIAKEKIPELDKTLNEILVGMPNSSFFKYQSVKVVSCQDIFKEDYCIQEKVQNGEEYRYFTPLISREKCLEDNGVFKKWRN